MIPLRVLPPALATAINAVADGGDLFVVGGFVRDCLLGRPSQDIDVVTTDDPARVARRLAARLDGAPFPLGAEHGVHRVTLRAPVEGVTYIDVAAQRGTIEHDLSLRDFTVNAMAWRPLTALLLDPHGGADDLSAGLLRLVSDNAVRSDPVRALRAVRFAAELGLTLAGEAQDVIRRDAHLLAHTAGERQRDELARVLETPSAATMLRLADGIGVLDAVLPELMPAKGCVQPREHYYDVFDHQVETVAVLDCVLAPLLPALPECSERFATLWDLMPDGDAIRRRYDERIAEGRTVRSLLKLIGLLHDVSKPETKERQPNGRIRFFGHAEQGAEKAARIMERLRFTGREIKLAHLLIGDHLRPGQLSNGRNLPTKRALYRFFRDLGEAVPDLLVLNLADHAAARGPLMPPEAWAGHIAYIHWILARRTEDEELVRAPQLVTGHDIMAELSLSPGPAIGRILEGVREAHAVGRIKTREQALRLARKIAQATPSPALQHQEAETPGRQIMDAEQEVASERTAHS
ncbi:MAG: CCA tRNA nucleotidyltransferase [Chloroflexi bacterium]|nr:CCA tRNA nucleotidyltransferase [Chloroflexota bacterium]